MADEDDDLDAFFDEVSEVEAKVQEEGEEPKKPSDDSKKDDGDDDVEPPAKRAKTSNPAPMRPRGVVVASSTSVVIPAKEREEKEKRAELEAASQHQHRQHHSSASNTAPTLGGRFVAAGPTVGPTNTNAATIGPAFPGNPQSNNPQQQQGQQQQQQQQDQAGKKKKAAVRMAAGQKWVDESLDEWPDNDFRIFVGNLANDVTDATLFQHFSKYPSVAKAKVVRHNNNPEKSKGYGFVSFLEATEMARALREMDQTWLASRPIRIKRSDWKERDFKVVKKRQKKEQKQRRY